MLCEYAFNEKHELVHVDSVPNGLACNCTCPCCKDIMIAHNGNDPDSPGRHPQHHFKHKSGVECKGYYETLMHILAKEIIAEEKCIMLPESKYFSLKQKQLNFESIEVEQRNDLNDLQPDIVGITKNRLRLCIEIAVTHKCDINKIQKIKENNINCIEIQIPKNISTKEELYKFLHFNPDVKYINVSEEFLNTIYYKEDDICDTTHIIEKKYLENKDFVILPSQLCKLCVYAPNKSYCIHGNCKYFKEEFKIELKRIQYFRENKIKETDYIKYKYVICKHEVNKNFETQHIGNYIEYLKHNAFNEN